VRRALLVIDVQNDLVNQLPPERRPELLGAVTALLEHARAAEIPVIYIRHNEDEGPLKLGTPAWEIATAVAPRDAEPIVEKRHADAFAETDLAGTLSERGITDLVLCGMQSDFCVVSTARGAMLRGFRTALAEDGHATFAANGKSERKIIAAIEAELEGGGVLLVPSAAAFEENVR
jgi:nicotinamidase-related amidase